MRQGKKNNWRNTDQYFPKLDERMSTHRFSKFNENYSR